MKREEIIAANETLRVRLIELQAAEATAWHRHSEVTDTMFGVSGLVVVSLLAPEQEYRLAPGMRCTVEPGRVHRVANAQQEQPAEYLLVQGVGSYDFIPCEVDG